MPLVLSLVRVHQPDHQSCPEHAPIAFSLVRVHQPDHQPCSEHVPIAFSLVRVHQPDHQPSRRVLRRMARVHRATELFFWACCAVFEASNKQEQSKTSGSRPHVASFMTVVDTTAQLDAVGTQVADLEAQLPQASLCK
eukprot:1160648-Pelagomonas_calceolata.AAC.8